YALDVIACRIHTRRNSYIPCSSNPRAGGATRTRVTFPQDVFARLFWRRPIASSWRPPFAFVLLRLSSVVSCEQLPQPQPPLLAPRSLAVVRAKDWNGGLHWAEYCDNQQLLRAGRERAV